MFTFQEQRFNGDLAVSINNYSKWSKSESEAQRCDNRLKLKEICAEYLDEFPDVKYGLEESTQDTDRLLFGRGFQTRSWVVTCQDMIKWIFNSEEDWTVWSTTWRIRTSTLYKLGMGHM